MRRQLGTRAAGAIAAALLLSSCVGRTTSATFTSRGSFSIAGQPVAEGPQGARTATAVRVLDGDTIEVRLKGKTERVRLTGIDTPEAGEPYAGEATALTAQLVAEGATVWLEYGPDRRDEHGRLLAWVWLRKPGRTDAAVRTRMLNARLIRAGLATKLTIAPNDEYAGLFARWEYAARDAQLGMWE